MYRRKSGNNYLHIIYYKIIIFIRNHTRYDRVHLPVQHLLVVFNNGVLRRNKHKTTSRRLQDFEVWTKTLLQPAIGAKYNNYVCVHEMRGS